MRITFAICLICMLALPLAGRADVIQLVADSWCPYNCEEGDMAPGYLIEIAHEALEMAGHEVHYQEMGWTRAIDSVRRGAATGLVGAIINEVPDFIFPKHFLGLVPNAYFTLQNSTWSPINSDAFASVRLGTIRDYDYGSNLQPWVIKKRGTIFVQEIQGNNALETNLRKLQFGRIDVVVDQRATILATAKKMGLLEQIRFAGEDPIRPNEDKLYIAFSPILPHSRQYAEDLDAGIENLRTNGRLEIILEKYGLTDWE